MAEYLSRPDHGEPMSQETLIEEFRRRFDDVITYAGITSGDRVRIIWDGANRHEVLSFAARNGWYVHTINTEASDGAYVRFAQLESEPDEEPPSEGVSEVTPNYGTLS